MKMVRARSRAMLLGLTATATAFGGIGALSTQATSATPTGDCAVAYPVAEVAAGQAVTGQTVSRGTAPEGFTGEVLGVIDNGIAFDLDMVVVRLSSAEIDRVGGIWSGMSGSPVYAADGRLIGAVAYGLAYGPSPVAGVTPFEEMDQHIAAPARSAEISGALARRIARTTEVTRQQAEQGLTQLPMPMAVSGTTRWALNKSGARPYLGPAVAGRQGTAAAQAGPADLVAGGNLGLTWAYGDVTGGGVGTVTSVCDGRLIGFGHPSADFLGDDTTYAMHPAEAVYVQEDPVSAPFKVANLGAPAGTITGDHLTGVSGAIGPVPTTYPVTSTVTYGSRSRVGSTQVSLPLGMAAATFYELAGNHTRVLDGVTNGSALTSWTISGTRADGTPFSLTRGNRYTGNDVVSRLIWELPDTVWMIGDFEGVTVTSVDHSSVVDQDRTKYELGQVQYRRADRWVTAKRSSAIVAKAGKTLQLRVTLNASDGTTDRVNVSTKVPAKYAGTRGNLSVLGGFGDEWYFKGARVSARAATVDDLLAELGDQARNDQVSATLSLGGRRTVERTVRTAPLDHVVNGSKWFNVRVR